MVELLRRSSKLLWNYRFQYAVIAFLFLLPRLGDLIVPYFAGRIFDALTANAAPAEINLLILQAAAFWVLHGNVLPYFRDWFDCRYYALPARQHLSEIGVRAFLSGVPTQARQELATMHQAVIEEGENRVLIIVDALARTAFPTVVMSLCALVVIFWWIPLLGFILLAGGMLDLAITFYANTRLTPRFERQQELAFRRQRQHRDIFNNILRILTNNESRSTYNTYSAGYTELTRFSIGTQTSFLGFRFGRDFILNVTNALTWVVGAWCVYNGTCTIGLFVMVLAWGARATELFGLVTHMHKVWLDHAPATRAYFHALENPNEPPRVEAPVFKPAAAPRAAAAVNPIPGVVKVRAR